MVPVSCNVTCTVQGQALPRLLHGLDRRRQAAILACSRSWQVSTSSISTPPSISARPALHKLQPSHRSDVSERRQLGGRAHRPGNEARPAFVENCCATSRASFAAAMLISRDPVLQVQIRQHDARPAESVGLDHVAADVEEVRMDVTNDVGTAQHQDFAAVLLCPSSRPGWDCGTGCWCPSRRRRRRRVRARFVRKSAHFDS